MSRPPLHSKFRRSVENVANLGRHVGGKQGKELRRLAISLANGPDLGISTRNAVSSQAASYLSALGAYRPDNVAIATLKRMRLDPQIQLALAATRSPIVEAPVFFESTSREAVAICEAAWNDTGLLRELQRTSLKAIEFGFAAHEKIWEAKEQIEITWGTPGKIVGQMDQKSKTFPLLFFPKKAKDLDPSLVTLLSDEYGNYQGLVYGTTPQTGENLAALLKRNGTENVLMPEKTFVFTLDEEWQNLYGRARQVSAYDPWFWQKIIYLIANRWYERKGDPPYVGWAPSDPTLLDPGTSEEEFDPNDETQSPILRLRNLIQNQLRSAGVLVLPSEVWKGDDGKPSTVKAYGVEEMGIADVHPAFLDYIVHLDSKKTRAMLVPDGAIAASENTGTYGSTQTLSQLAIKIQNETLSSWVRHFNRYYLDPFLRYNGIKERCVLRTTGVSADNRDVLLALLEKTYDADILLEQAWGPQFPDSLSRLVSRRQLLRGLNIPYEAPDPDAPAPTLPKPPPQPEGSGGGDKPKGKKKTGLSVASGAWARVNRAQFRVIEQVVEELTAGRIRERDAEEAIVETAPALSRREVLAILKPAAKRARTKVA